MKLTFITNFMRHDLAIIVVKFAFHRFEWNRHRCHSSICIIRTSMSCALFRHECHMPIRIVETWMLYVYPYCLHTKVVHITFVFKQCMTFMFKQYEPMK